MFPLTAQLIEGLTFHVISKSEIEHEVWQYCGTV
jgi:hypothetical protein